MDYRAAGMKVVEFRPAEGYPYHETLSAVAGTKGTPSEMLQGGSYLWPTMDYMVENGRFGTAMAQAGVILALVEFCHRAPIGDS